MRPHRIILDPDATIDEDGYTGDRIGEFRKLSASKILVLIDNDPENKDAAEATKLITEKVGESVGTKINFIEWWTPEYMCWKLEKTILAQKEKPALELRQDRDSRKDRPCQSIRASRRHG